MAARILSVLAVTALLYWVPARWAAIGFAIWTAVLWLFWGQLRTMPTMRLRWRQQRPNLLESREGIENLMFATFVCLLLTGDGYWCLAMFAAFFAQIAVLQLDWVE